MSHTSIIDLYTELASNPDKEFGWDKGLQNARNHHYKEAWIAAIPQQVWAYCAAVGNPFEAGDIGAGEAVLDTGCGAGVDLCVASLLVGSSGQVTGIDITPAMVEKARQHANLAMLPNITVLQGSIQQLPIRNNTFHSVISNGAINLAASKQQVFAEIYRVLKDAGKLYFSDMIKLPPSPETACCSSEESWADCVAGTLTGSELISLLTAAGFSEIELLSTNHYKTSASTVGATFRAIKLG